MSNSSNEGPRGQWLEVSIKVIHKQRPPMIIIHTKQDVINDDNKLVCFSLLCVKVSLHVCAPRTKCLTENRKHAYVSFNDLFIHSRTLPR